MASICSAHPWVLKTALQGDGPVLIEATCNQVNQFGGYTGMTPVDFVRFVGSIAEQNGFPKLQLLLGGDHLGPSPWQEEPAANAMAKAVKMVRAYVRAGFIKIHLDASMRLADDPPGPLSPEVSALRTAQLARIAEESIVDMAIAPRYVIGTEVPVPGGAREHEAGVSVTTVEDARHTYEITQAARGGGIAVNLGARDRHGSPTGVEFGDDFVLDYNPVAAGALARFSETLPLVFEAHSTDYQKREHLRLLARDHFAILKVGPALTFAFREAVFALSMMENELMPAERRSNLMDVLEDVMIHQPEHWKKYYRGDETALRLKRKFSLSDRIRYYWSSPPVQRALDQLIQNLGGNALPPALVSQYLPSQWERIRSGQIANSLEPIILDKINYVLADYAFANRDQRATYRVA
jgi:D-tagatose-1,6-bisphosphate aldolase subunit GatZ/KbaZ